MIKINLALRKQSASANVVADEPTAGASALTSLTLKGFRFDARLDGLEEVPLKRIGALIVLAVAVHYLAGSYQQAQIDEVNAELASVKAEQSKLQADVNKTKDYLPLKKQLEADELMIRTKIRTVRDLIADRQTPPRLFAALSGATPPEVWLHEVKIETDRIFLKGFAANVGDIPDFMKMIAESAYFTDILLEETKTGKDERANEIATFSLGARRRREEAQP